MTTETPSHFLREIIAEDLRTGRHTSVVTRFPPEPNGFLHIGHAKAIAVNFGMAAEFGGRCHLRFDDTNPLKEEASYEAAIEADIQWLGYDWGTHLYHASDYFEALYGYAVQLIERGLAYVCDLTEEEIRGTRGTVTEPGAHSPYRDRGVAENLDLFARMRAGEFPDGARVLRAKIDMAAVNMKMRDPLLYRIRHAHHHRTGDAWCIYPFYDFAHCLSDSIERITHSMCTLEFDVNRELYDWILEHVDVPEPRPHQYEYARLKIAYAMMSKRNLLHLVTTGVVSGWDDPRMPTLAAFRRRGVRPEAIRAFVERVGVSKADSLVDLALLEHTIRDDLNHEAPRVMGVLDPVALIVESWEDGHTEWIDASLWPHDVPRTGTRKVPFTRHLWIERSDFAEEPPRKWKRLAPGREVRLRYGYWVRCVGVERDADGRVTAVRCVHDPATRGGDDPPDGRKASGTIHWVSAEHALPATFRVYEQLFAVERPGGEDWLSQLTPDSFVEHSGWIEPSVGGDAPDTRYQLERTGYFWRDPVDGRGDGLVFNRIVALKDGWGRSAEPAAPPTPRAPGPTPAPEIAPAIDPEVAAAARQLADDRDIAEGDARVLVSDGAAMALFDAVRPRSADARTVAGWIVNELPRVVGARSLDGQRFDAAALAALLDLIAAGTLTARLGKQVLEVLATEGGDPAAIARDRGWTALADVDALRRTVDEVIRANPEQWAKVAENPRMLGFFVGQVMKATGGRAPGDAVQALLRERADRN